MKKIEIILILIVVTFASCNSQTDGDEDHSAQSTISLDTELIELTELQVEKIGLRTARIDSQALTNSRKFNGYVAAHPSYKADITSLVNGKISNIRILPGQKVKKGQVLMLLENPDIVEWQREYITHLNEAKFLEPEYQRQKELYEKNLIALREFQIVESDYNVLVGDLMSLKTKLEMIGLDPDQVASGKISQQLPIRSPINGYVDDLAINSGAYIQNFQTLTTVIDPEHLHIEMNVFEKDLPFIGEGSKVVFWVNHDVTRQYEAEVFSVGRIVDPVSRTVLIHADILGEHQFSEGMYIQAGVVINDEKSACLPSDAIVSDQGLSYIFVKDESGDIGFHFRKVPVIAGVTEMGFTAIEPLESLSPEAEVVVNGSFFLLAQAKRMEGGGVEHAH